MQIVLTQSDIEKAIEAHINALGVSTAGKSVTVKISSTRNPAGYAAAVEITELSLSKQVSENVPVAAVVEEKADEEAVAADEATDVAEAEAESEAEEAVVTESESKKTSLFPEG